MPSCCQGGSGRQLRPLEAPWAGRGCPSREGVFGAVEWGHAEPQGAMRTSAPAHLRLGRPGPIALLGALPPSPQALPRKQARPPAFLIFWLFFASNFIYFNLY